MKKIIGGVLILSLGVSVAYGNKTASSAANSVKATASKKEKKSEWPRFKNELKAIAERFQDKKLSNEKKIDLLPRANEVLSDIQDLKYTPEEKADQIRTVVDFISKTIETDVVNSNSDTIYFDYKANKKAYLAEINKVKSSSVKAEMLEAFKALEDFEKDAEKPESESDYE